MDTSISTDECCVCLGTYTEDFDTDGLWIKCCSDRWIYEDCVDSEDIDNITGFFVLFVNNLFVYNLMLQTNNI